MRTIIVAAAASLLIVASLPTYAASPGGRGGGGSGSGTAGTSTPNNSHSQEVTGRETVDTQCANILAGGYNGTSAQRRYCRQRGY
jgi:hypothetical protein